MREQKTENWLNKHGYKYVYVKTVPFADIDLEMSRDNPARTDRKLDQNRALEYSIRMLDGDEFPALIALNHPSPHDSFKWIVATGMHRIEAAILADKTSFDCYCVTEGDEYKREWVVRFSNQLEGKGMSTQDEINHALWLHEHYGKPIAELARKAGLKVSMLQNAFSEQRTRERARRAGWEFGPRISQATALALGSIKLDNVFNRAAEFFSTTFVSGADAKDMASEINKLRDEPAQIKVVERYQDAAQKTAEFTRAARSKGKPVAITRLMGAVKRLRNSLLKPFKELHIGALEDAIPSQIAIIDDLQARLKLLKEAMQQVHRMNQPPSQQYNNPGLRKRDNRPEARP